MRSEKSPIEIHNVMSHIGGGGWWMGTFEFVTKCDRG